MLLLLGRSVGQTQFAALSLPGSRLAHSKPQLSVEVSVPLILCLNRLRRPFLIRASTSAKLLRHVHAGLCATRLCCVTVLYPAFVVSFCIPLLLCSPFGSNHTLFPLPCQWHIKVCSDIKHPAVQRQCTEHLMSHCTQQ